MLVQLMKSREQNLYLQKKYNVTAYFYDILDYPWERIYRKWRPKLVGDLRGKILEVGVGTGRNLETYHEDVELVGIELSKQMLSKAEKRIKKARCKVRLIHEDATAMQSIDSHQFDQDVGELLGLAQGLEIEGGVGPAWDVVEHDRQRQLGGKAAHVSPELGRGGRIEVGRGEDHGLGPGLGGAPGEGQRLDDRGVGDPDKHRHAARDLAAAALDQLSLQPVAQARRLSRCPEQEEPVHAPGQDVLDEPLEAVDVEGVTIPQGSDHRWDDALQGPGQRGWAHDATPRVRV